MFSGIAHSLLIDNDVIKKVRKKKLVHEDMKQMDLNNQSKGKP